MAHFARIKNNIVDFVVVGRDDDENNEDQLSHDGWIYKRTSYNTRGGVYYNTDNTPSDNQSKAFRKNYAGIGYTYDEVRDAFIPPKPYESWILDEFSCLWNSPIPYPDISHIPEYYKLYNIYYWNESIINWELIKPYNSWVLFEDNYYIAPIPYPNDNQNYYWDDNQNIWILY
jgi:hypothetical protein